MDEIVLVEDSDSDARLIQRTLQLAGVHNPVRHYWTGQEALNGLSAAEKRGRKGEGKLPGILIIDLKLPDMTGYDILLWLQSRKAYQATLRIVLSQLEDIPSIKKAYAFGANSFLTKPARQEDLDELIRVYPAHWMLQRGPAMLATQNRI
jgi:two-component system response regulator